VDGVGGKALSDGHLACNAAGVVVSEMFMGHDTEAGLADVKSAAGQVSFSLPPHLRRQFAEVAPGTAITITYQGSTMAARCSR
jgi:hypothetical protein